MADKEAQEPTKEPCSDRELLIRIDERTTHLARLVDLAPQTYVSKGEFAPIKKVVYLFVTLIITGVLSAGVALAMHAR